MRNHNVEHSSLTSVTNLRLTRRGVLVRSAQLAGGATLVAAVTRTGIGGALAQSTPTSDAGSALSGLGLPEITINITDTSFEGAPATVPAGRYLITAINKMTNNGENTGAVGFLSGTSIGMSSDDILQFLGEMSQPAESSPTFVYQLHFAGGVFSLPGTVAHAVVDLTPGDYVIWGDDPTVPQAPVALSVTGEFPQDVPEPAAEITATLIDFGITIEGTLTAGKHVLKVQHQGAQPHFLDIERGPDTMTKEQVQASFESSMTGTPVAGGLSESDLQPRFYSPTQSIGTVTYQEIDLEAGTYMAACFFPTAGTGVPHAMNGMIDVFSITD
jgi:hypothetical protein